MVFKKLLSSLGFGGVDVDTVLAAPTIRPGAPLTGQVNLRAKGDVDVTTIELLLVATTAGGGELELARHRVVGATQMAAGTSHAIPFEFTTPVNTPMTLLYGQLLPGVAVGIRTQVAVASGSAKTDFDPVAVEASPTMLHIIDALGTIGCRFVRNELRPGALSVLPAATVQAITFYAPVPEGQPVGPHIPQLVFSFAADPAGTPGALGVAAELAQRPGTADLHEVSAEQAQRLGDDGGAWIEMVDAWVRDAVEKLGQAPPARSGAFLQAAPAAPAGPPLGGPGGQPGRGQYAYPGQGQQGYRYGGYRGGAGSAIAAGVGGAALGFLGGMMIGNMMGGAFGADAPPEAGGQEGVDSSGADTAAYEDPGGGYDDGGFGGDFGGGFSEF